MLEKLAASCLRCGAEIAQNRRGRPRLYCSTQCQRAIAKRRARAKARESRVEQRRGLACETCGESLTERRAERFCSKRCADIARGYVRAEPLPDRVCELPTCRAIYSPSSTLQRCCSYSHVKALYRLEHADEIRAAREPWGDKRRDAYHRRRALKRSASTGRPVILSEIAQRDGFQCQLCQKPVDLVLTWPDPMSKSLDHIVPLSLGGAHDPDNVQLAHLRCNVAKGARLPA